ncbi:hypothetical protein PISMIDRAFT_66220, partial [Pisolithus microcarpus 441]
SYSAYVWLADSATTSHICAQREAFSTYEALSNKTVDVLHVPTSPNNLFSIGRLDAQGGRSICAEGHIKLVDPSGDTIAIGRRDNHLYKLQFESIANQHESNRAVETRSWESWH